MTTSTDAPAINIARDRIRPEPDQPRRIFTEIELAELRESLREHGQLQEVLVRHEPSRLDGTPYILVAGERRWRASEGVLDTLRCREVNVDEAGARRLTLVENLQRVNLTPLEEARGIAALMQAEGLSQLAAARELGKHPNWVTNRLKLLKTAEDVQEVAAIAPDKMIALVEIDKVKDDPEERRALLEMAARSDTSNAAIMERLDALKQRRKLQVATRQAPDEETQERLAEQARSGGGQMSRGRMVTGTPESEARRQIEAALSELERHILSLEAWSHKVDRAYVQQRVEPRTARLRSRLRRIGAGEAGAGEG